MFSIYLTYSVPKHDFSQISLKLLGHFLPVALGRRLFLLLGPEGSDHFLSVLAPKFLEKKLAWPSLSESWAEHWPAEDVADLGHILTLANQMGSEQQGYAVLTGPACGFRKEKANEPEQKCPLRSLRSMVRCRCSAEKPHPPLWDPTDCCTPGSSLLCYLLEFTEIHIHWVSDAS